MVSVNDDTKHMINTWGVTTLPLKRISSRDSERKTLKGREADQPSKQAGQSHTRED